MSVPSISLLLPIHNGIRYLPQIRQLISGNSEVHDEILLISDGSTDGTNEFLQAWESTDPRVRLILKSKSGLVDTLNIGLTEATFDWIARFDVDDVYPTNRLKLQRSLIAQDVAAIFADYEFRSETGFPLGRVPSGVIPLAMQLSLISANRTAHPVVIFNKEAAINVGGYKAEDFPAEDLSLWMRIQSEGKLLSVPRVLLNYTLTQNSVTQTNRVISKQKRDELVQFYLGSLDFSGLFSSRKSIQSQFKSIEWGTIRYLFFLNELLKLSKYKKANRHKKLSLWFEICFHLLNLWTLLQVVFILFQKLTRSLYRFLR